MSATTGDRIASNNNSTTFLDEYQKLLVSVGSNTGDEAITDGDDDDDGDTTTSSRSPIGITTISTTDITSSDTLLIVDVQHDFLPGGTFGVEEGFSILDGVCDLISKFDSAGGTIIATRDYHPRDHCSFTTQGGPFPCHCIQGTNGSFLHEHIVTALQPLLADDEKSKRTHVVYKAFTKDIDSFGAFQYTDETFHPHTLVRGSNEKDTKSENENIKNSKNDQSSVVLSTEDENDLLEGDGWERRLSHTDHCSLEWTGGYTLYSSNLMEDANAPPDVMSIFEKRPLGDLLPKTTSKRGDDDDDNNNSKSIGRLFVCGLAYDYCVIDSTINFCRYKEKNNITTGGKCFIIQDLTRAAYIPGVGQFGSGFLTDPKIMYDKLQKNNIQLMKFE